jgi:hypothetical protein
MRRSAIAAAPRWLREIPQTISHVALINTVLRLNRIIPKRAPTDRAIGEYL